MQNCLLPYVLAIITNDQKQVLLSYRIATQWFNNHYSLIGGAIEKKESAKQALIRELSEELEISAAYENIEFVHVMHFMGKTRPCVGFFYRISTWQGTITNKEPEKCGNLQWFSFDQLPDNIIPRHKKALLYFLNGISYSEDDW